MYFRAERALQQEAVARAQQLNGVGYIYSYADWKTELTFAKSIVYVILWAFDI